MIIREITEKDLYQSAACMVECFGGGIEPQDLRMPADKTVLAAFEDDDKTLCAQLEYLEKEVNFDGGILSCAAVGGVSSFARARRKGAVRALFRELQTNPAYAKDVSILYPFSSTYYRKFGYDSAGRCMRLEIPSSALASVERCGDVYVAENSDLATLVRIYNENAKKDNLSFVRDGSRYFNANPYRTAEFTYITKDNTGYADLWLRRDIKTIVVREISFGSYETLRTLLGFIRNFDSSMNTVAFEKLPLGSPVLHLIDDRNKAVISASYCGSVRINDVKKVLASKRYRGNGSFTLRVDGKGYRAEYSDGAVLVTEYDGKADIEMTVADASRALLCGLSGADEASYMPGVTVNNPSSDFFSCFTPSDAFYTDGF